MRLQVENLSFLKNGTVILSDPKEGIYIKCKEGILKVLEIQGENSKRMSIQDISRLTRIEIVYLLYSMEKL